MTTTVQDVQSAAELERQRLAAQAVKTRAEAQAQARSAEAQVEAQVGQAISETEQQTQVARAQAQQEAETRQAQIRKQQGTTEVRAQTAIAKARKAQIIESRKAVLPFTKPRDIGTVSYIASVEAARKQAHRTGRDTNVAVAKVRDDYFIKVDKARDDAVADIQKQKVGIITDIQTQLVNYNTDLTKQLAQLNSGIDSWQVESETAIKKAQVDYEAAIKAALDRNGTDVFADMQSKGLISANAIYDSYDKTTGQLNYTIPDTRSGEEIFADLQSQNTIPPNAIYKSYDSDSGEISYTTQTPNFGSSVFKSMQNAGKIPYNAAFISYNATNKTVTYFVTDVGTVTIPDTTSTQATPDKTVTSVTSSTTTNLGQNSTNVIAISKAAMPALAVVAVVGAGSAALETGLWTGAVFDPEPFSKIALLIAAAVVTYFAARKVQSIIKDSQEAQRAAQSGDAVVTDNAGTVAYTLSQFKTITKDVKGNIEYIPWEKAGDMTLKNIPPKIEPFQEKLTLAQERLFQTGGIPLITEPLIVIIRDPFDVPELRQKASNIMVAATAVQAAINRVQTATKTIPMSREQWNQVEEALRQGRVAEGKRIIEGLAKKAGTPEIARHMTEAYREYLRKKAILDAARKSYVASLNPQPIQGRGSADATAAAIGVWLTQDIIQGEILKALNRGESMQSAMARAQAKIRNLSKYLGLTQQQVNAASATVVYQAALSSMAQEAIKAASMGQSQGLTATQIKTQTLTATKQAVQTVVQQAVETNTITQTQANTLVAELDQVAAQVAIMTMKLKLPELSEEVSGRQDREKYPNGTIVWNMGRLSGKGDEYKIIPPPYDLLKPITSFKPPKGMTKTKGTPQETLTFIGGKVPFENVSFDLGVTDGFIDVKSRTIKFTGRGLQTDVGTRIESTTKGVALRHNPPLVLQRRYDINRVQEPHRGSVLTGVGYTDKAGRRLSRRHHRGFKRVRFT